MKKTIGQARKGRIGKPAPKLVALVKPVSKEESLNLGPNVSVKFSLKDFVYRLFVQTLGYGAFYKGPGPLKKTWGFEVLEEAVGHSPDFNTYDVHYQRAFCVNYLAEEMLSKFDDGSPSPSKMSTAIERFDFAESRCKLANSRFEWDGVNLPVWANPRKRTPYMCPETGTLYSVEALKSMRAARDILSGMFKYDEDVVKNSMYFAGHGPGASSRLSRRDAHQSGKWSGSLHITENAVKFGEAFLRENPGYAAAGGSFFIYPGNLLTTVSKNFQTYRFIAMEPEGNMLYQKSLAHVCRRALMGVGIDLRSQQRNKDAAQSAVFEGYTTQDSKVASDTVARNPCSYFFPRWFYDHLMASRSPVGFHITAGRQPSFVPDGSGGYTVSNGRQINYEKISSMGNGDTFEVETCLLYALAKGVCSVLELNDAKVLVYGDDVVLPTAAWPLFREVLDFVGFVPNDNKTHSDGPFRESCGGHYWCGTDVTPFYIREDVSHLDRLFLLHNNVWRWFDRNPHICEPQKVRELLAWIRSHAPEEWRRPRLHHAGIGDGAFIGKPHIGQDPKNFWDRSRELAPTRRFHGWEGYGVNVLLFEAKADRVIDDLTHSDRKAAFAGIWTGTKYEAYQMESPTLGFDDLGVVSHADVPWKQRYWSIGIQVCSAYGDASWF